MSMSYRLLVLVALALAAPLAACSGDDNAGTGSPSGDSGDDTISDDATADSSGDDVSTDDADNDATGDSGDDTTDATEVDTTDDVTVDAAPDAPADATDATDATADAVADTALDTASDTPADTTETPDADAADAATDVAADTPIGPTGPSYDVVIDGSDFAFANGATARARIELTSGAVVEGSSPIADGAFRIVLVDGLLHDAFGGFAAILLDGNGDGLCGEGDAVATLFISNDFSFADELNVAITPTSSLLSDGTCADW